MTKITTVCENYCNEVYQFQHLSEGVLFVFASDPSLLCIKTYENNYIMLDKTERFGQASDTELCYFVDNVHIKYTIIT